MVFLQAPGFRKTFGKFNNKTDTNGSAEAIAGAINNLKVEDAKIKIVLDGVGPVSVNDVNLAVASEAVILGFNVRSDAQQKRLQKPKR